MVQRTLFSAALLALTLTAARGEAQIPSEFTNLKLLDPATTKKDLVGIMRVWAGALGVRCNYCHVGPEDLVGMDFASDEKATKRTARRMLEMARVVNREYLASLPTTEADDGTHRFASCYTCHRGLPKPPRQLTRELSLTAQSQGVDAAIEQYRSLRREYYGTGRYDFSEYRLTNLADLLLEHDQVADAIRVLELNLEFYPDSAPLHGSLGKAQLRRGDRAAARASFERALELEPGNEAVRKALAEIAGDGS